jgi:pimeloyl-ACP methyl ester carboxylesterase
MPRETIIGARCGGGRPGPLRSILLAGAVHLALIAEAHAGGVGEGFVIRSGGAELRSALPRAVGKLPVVFVHGMLGSPGNWSVMLEGLSADPTVHGHFQLLTFRYDSLRPIPESGQKLLAALGEARRRFDPEGCDPSFEKVVLVGHSMGGLVAKAAAHAPGPQPSETVDRPASGIGRPVTPRVGRVIFIATPHRGSPLDRGAVRSAGSWLARNISASSDVEGSWLTSVDQLTWDHPLLAELETARAAEGAPFHSIIAALRDPSAKGATDGLVPVASARLGGARSEVVVLTHHLCLQHPEVIREVHRVLREHAAEAARSPQPGVVTRNP